ncbi:hypothetical protein T06_4787 [Trichinella sp. T6]|nr:hypothetical protein T06_4787 [Trichinella sp. T6]
MIVRFILYNGLFNSVEHYDYQRGKEEGGEVGKRFCKEEDGGGLGKEKKETKAGLLLSRQTAGLRLGKVRNAQRYRLEKETDRQKNNKTKSKQTLKNETGGIKRTTNIFALWDRQTVETEVELRKVSENVENPSRWWENEVTGAARPPQAIPSLLSLVDTGR